MLGLPEEGELNPAGMRGKISVERDVWGLESKRSDPRSIEHPCMAGAKNLFHNSKFWFCLDHSWAFAYRAGHPTVHCMLGCV